jgi:hypothetical protein
MIFKNKENGREHELNKIEGTDFWYNNHEELFIVDEPTGYCYQTTALHALESILRRKNMRNALCCMCQETPHREVSKGHSENYLENYFKKWG